MTPAELIRLRALEAHAQQASETGTEEAAREALAAYARMIQIASGDA